LNECNKIRSLYHIVSLTKLTFLDIGNTFYLDNFMEPIESLTQLKSSNISCKTLFKNKLSALTNLTYLEVSKSSELNLNNLPNLPLLTSFTSKNLYTTITSFITPLRFPSIKYLNYGGNEVSQIVISMICKLKTLEYIDFTDCYNITTSSLDILYDELPNLKSIKGFDKEIDPSNII